MPQAPNITTKKAFASLLTRPADLQRVFNAFHAALRESFTTDGKMRNATEAETKRRFDILCNWFRVFRADLGWSTDRSLQECRAALFAELRGETYVPQALVRSMYRATG